MKPPWLVLGPRDGEALRLRPPSRSGNVTIKVDRRRAGSPFLAAGRQRLGPGASIPVHLHEHQDEIIFVHAGRGAAVFDGHRLPLRTGSTIFVRRRVWHGVENTGRSDLHLLWIISPPGLEDMFRDISVRKGRRPRPMTRDEFAALVRRHRMHVRPAAGAATQAGGAPAARGPAASRAARRRPRRRTLRPRPRSSARRD
ncbi:MAG TPA: cupin domain-containing protein [bacterium]|nr:cupin domain-containing protein [bacterium]